MSGYSRYTVVGGGIAGLVAAIEIASAGGTVHLLEAHRELGGRARTSDGRFKANLGPHVVYADGAGYAWLKQHRLLPPARRGPLYGLRLHYDGRSRRNPPAPFRAVRRLREHTAPVDVAFREWAAGLAGDEAARVLSNAATVFSFDHDPGRLSAAFVAERGARVLSLPPAPRYVIGGWQRIVESLERRALDLGVAIERGAKATELPEPPVIVATELADARALVGEPLAVETGRSALLDLGLRRRRGDAFAVPDLDEGGWLERFSAPDRSLAPEGHDLVQGHVGIRPGETADDAVKRLEPALDGAFPGWREREVWRRRLDMSGRTGAVDLPGTTWRDRPPVELADGVYLAGDYVAAPGLLSEVAYTSAVQAAAAALKRRVQYAAPAGTGYGLTAENP